MRFVALAAALPLVLLAACDRREEPPPPPEPKSAAAGTVATTGQHLPAGIAWFDGDVDAAFATARSANKPVFLYWGAEWCPPCAQIKSTIFNKREFQERSRLFVPVYLDGDTPSAQKHGEHFGVIGYPTMILFRPDGTEITRLPGGVDVARYATVLDAALAEARPVAEILAAARSGGAVSDNDWRLLAFYSWSTDNGRVLPEEQRLATFRTVTARCPATLPGECARLFFEYLGAAVAESEPKAPALDGLARADARKQVLTLLPVPSVQAANVDNLLYGSQDVIEPAIGRGHPRTHRTHHRLARGAGSPRHALVRPPHCRLRSNCSCCAPVCSSRSWTRRMHRYPRHCSTKPGRPSPGWMRRRRTRMPGRRPSMPRQIFIGKPASTTMPTGC